MAAVDTAVAAPRHLAVVDMVAKTVAAAGIPQVAAVAVSSLADTRLAGIPRAGSNLAPIRRHPPGDIHRLQRADTTEATATAIGINLSNRYGATSSKKLSTRKCK